MSAIEKKIVYKLKNLTMLMRENDVLTRQLSKCGRNIKKARDYIIQSKKSYDKYKNYAKFTATVQNEILKKLDELEKGNKKMKEMLTQKLNILQKTQKVDMKTLNQIKPAIKQTQTQQKTINKDQQENKNLENTKLTQHQVASKLTFQEVQSMKDNQLDFKSNANKDRKIRYIQEIKKTSQEVVNYQSLLLDLQLSKLNKNKRDIVQAQSHKQVYMQDFYEDLYDKFNIPLNYDLTLKPQNEYLDSLKRMYYRNNSILDLSRQKLKQINLD